MLFKRSETGNIIVKGKLRFDVKDITKKHKSKSKNNGIRTSMIMLDFDYQGFYKSLLKLRFNKGLQLNPSLRGSHITIIKDDITNFKFYKEAKREFDNEIIEVELDMFTGLQFGKDHCWFRISDESREPLYKIRKACGLSPYRNFHMTVGRVNPKPHSIYEFNKIKDYFQKNGLKL